MRPAEKPVPPAPRRRALLVAVAAWAVLFTAPLALAQPDAPTDPLGLTFVRLEPGRFMMGSPESEWQSRVDELRHDVTLTGAVLMSAHEITQRQWRAVMGDDPSYLYICPDCPVERVSWYDAVAFCNAASLQAGFTPAYVVADSTVTWNRQADGYRLPTEAEWEYACRAGTETAYSTGRCLGADQANFNGGLVAPHCQSGVWRGQTVPVGSFAPNAWGLYDLHGNVSEWCWDRYGPYDLARRIDPAGPDTGPAADPAAAPGVVTKRVLRGGSFDRADSICRSACRQSSVPSNHSRYLGFRLARTVQ